jgi:hypothetical protein
LNDFNALILSLTLDFSCHLPSLAQRSPEGEDGCAHFDLNDLNNFNGIDLTSDFWPLISDL